MNAYIERRSINGDILFEKTIIDSELYQKANPQDFQEFVNHIVEETVKVVYATAIEGRDTIYGEQDLKEKAKDAIGEMCNLPRLG